MSAALYGFRTLALIATLSLGAALAGCTGYSGDAGAKRTQQQSEQLRDRINTTQTDR